MMNEKNAISILIIHRMLYIVDGINSLHFLHFLKRVIDCKYRHIHWNTHGSIPITTRWLADKHQSNMAVRL